ncbi:MAG TPA: energy transducer TonB [Candidatus Elarobacter sp.]|nr:energy transducer TonB [Candidatus Elarobacter sp.]
MRRLGSALLTIMFLAAAAPPALADGDRLAELVGTWSCRTATGGMARVVVEQSAPDTVVLRDERYYEHNTLAERETFRRDAASGGWRAESQGPGFFGSGPAWTGDSWVLQGAFRAPWLAQAEPRQLHFERLDADTFRTFATLGTAEETSGGELCRRGRMPPDARACVVPNAPAYVVHAAEPSAPYGAGAGGVVRVLVSLDADSHVTAAAIRESPASVLNAASIAAARRSTYQTALRDCKPVPSQYLFAVQYSM